jgi:hypothetical protein
LKPEVVAMEGISRVVGGTVAGSRITTTTIKTIIMVDGVDIGMGLVITLEDQWDIIIHQLNVRIDEFVICIIVVIGGNCADVNKLNVSSSCYAMTL